MSSATLGRFRQSFRFLPSPNSGMRSSSSDGDMESSKAWKVADPIQVPVGPITRARAKKFKEALNGLIHEFWNQVNLCKPIDQGPRQPQRCINLIQILEDSTNLA
ncbi:hypothetical protein TIFTF001_021115 [Ficus carica]|uniref:Uncharacterized protein n=1 Tax=Ficus carica TaxID=3494 RepID=A0AA88AF75_FICCA|nr:hypothetical protein TIFTF001_021115 [Ficus carica]